MKLNYIDVHSHLNMEPLLGKQEAVLAKMKELQVGTITVGTGLETSRRAVEIAQNNPGVCWATVGVHPCHTCGGEAEDFNEQEMANLANLEQVIAIGETGLDYFHEDTPESRLVQEAIFKKHIALAEQVNKPLMLHVRASKAMPAGRQGSDDAYYDALEILKQVSYQGKANFHFFSGSKQCMQDIVSAGYTVSVDGPITFSRDYDEMIRACPVGSLMIETDAPFAAPAPYRGKTCEPWMVIEVAKKIAELKELELAVVQEQMLENARDFFGLDL